MTEQQSQEEALPEPTAPELIPVSARGFTDTTDAENFAHHIAYTVRAISRYIDLSRLDGITVAFDYDEALAELDRGYEPTRTLTRTSDNRVIGVAMAPAVIRDSVVKSHLVFHAPMVMPILDENDENYRQALYLIAHECAHIEELHLRDKRFPGTILQAVITDFEEALLSQTSEAIWSEYAACRLSGVFGAEQAPAYEEGLVGALGAAREEANTAIRAYRLHGNLNRVIEEAGRSCCEPLRLAAYLIGHLDGRNESWDVVPDARGAVADSEYAPFIERMTEVLRELWETAESWESPTVFNPLHVIVREVFEMGGLTLIRQDDGSLYVDIPFSDGTMPL